MYKTQGIFNKLPDQCQCRFKSSGMLRHVNWYVFIDFFYVLLTVHLSIILVNNELNAQILVL